MRYIESVEVHDHLNPLIWTSDGKLKKDVKEKIYEIIDEFIDYCDVDLELVDAHLVGSNASYNYNSKSALDLHLVINFSLMDASKEILQTLFNKEKASFNDKYNISIHGVDIEIYIEDINAGTMSNGIYSIFLDKWIKYPKPIIIDTEYDFNDTVSKWIDRKNIAIKNKNIEDIKDLINTAYLIRKNSLAIDGEYGQGNLLFKELRNKGIIQELRDALIKIKSNKLSLESFF